MRYGLLLLCLAGCSQAAAQDEIERRGAGVAIQVLSEFGNDTQQVAPQVSEPIADEHTATPQDSEPVKYMPPDDDLPPPSKPCFLVFTARWCTYCRPALAYVDRLGSDGYKVAQFSAKANATFHIVHQETDIAAFRKWQPESLPCYVKFVDGQEVGRKHGMQTDAQLLAWMNAPEVAAQRPFSESWRQNLPREAWRVRNLVHTDCESASLALPTTVLHLKEQSIQFADSRESRLNRWFSVSFGAGTVSHSGSTVEFSNPPELRFHLFANREGEVLDSLKAIEFVSGGAKLHLTRFGSINFRVK